LAGDELPPGYRGLNCRTPYFWRLQDNKREWRMAFRTNYRFERAERDRAKKAKKEEKLKKRQGDVAPLPDEPERSDEHSQPDQ
jgi:hypothetical protein